MDPQSLFSCISSRRSCRRYEDRPIAAEMVEQLIAAASWAPSAHNRQPWRFVVIEQREVKEQLATAMGAKLRRDLTADNVPATVIEADVTRSYGRLANAPLIILLALSMGEMDSYSDSGRNQNEYVMAVQSTAMAAQNILLMAHAHQLGACWLCAPLFAPEIVRATLELPDDWQPQGLITLGYPAEQRSKTRKAIDDVVVYR